MDGTTVTGSEPVYGKGRPVTQKNASAWIFLAQLLRGRRNHAVASPGPRGLTVLLSCLTGKHSLMRGEHSVTKIPASPCLGPSPHARGAH